MNAFLLCLVNLMIFFGMLANYTSVKASEVINHSINNYVIQKSKKSESIKVKYKSGKKTFRTKGGDIYEVIKYKIPIFDGSSNGVEIINKYYNKLYSTWFSDIENNLSYDEESIKEIWKDYPYMKGAYFEHEFICTVKYSKNGYISITEKMYDNGLGAHGHTIQTSHTFNVDTGKEITLKNVLKGSDKQIKEIIVNAFKKKIDNCNDVYTYYDNALDIVKETASADFKDWYLNKNGIVFFYNEYEIACYAKGIQTASFAYNKAFFKIKIK